MRAYHFFAFLRRMRFIRRWGLMHNTLSENNAEHSLEVAWIAHQLAVLRNTYYDGHIDVGQVALVAMYHDVSEIFTGDMPTPIKYFDQRIRQVYGDIEKAAQEKLVNTLPSEVQYAYKELIIEPEQLEVWPLVKAADTLSAYMKCLSEVAAGNKEFKEALETIRQKLETYNMPEVAHFLKLYAPSLTLSLDQLNYKMERKGTRKEP